MTLVVVQNIVNSQQEGATGYTFLQLVQRLSIEAGASGVGPQTTLNQVGEYGRMVNWINAAWMDIQCLHQDWDWMRTSATVPTVTGQANYPLSQMYDINGNLGITNFGEWDKITGRNYANAQGIVSEVFMDWIPYEEWRDMYLYGALRETQSRPIVWSIMPRDHSINLGPVPIVGYTFEVDYFQAPAPMVNDTDIPSLPQQWQLAIVYRAMMFYGKYEKDSQLIADNKLDYDKIMRQAMADRLPMVSFGPALA